MSKHHLNSLLCPTATVTEEQLETDRRILAFDRTVNNISRRGFFGTMMAATVAATLTGSRKAMAQSTTPPAIVDVLNFALNLEYLEANFYLYVSTGTGLTGAQNGGGVAVEGAPPQLPLDASTLSVVQALAVDEVNHIADLRSAITTLGGTPIPQPLINLAANGAITTQAQFLAAARQFTALGGSAYAGSAQFLISNPTVLQTAAQILGAEGQHAGVVDYLCVTQNVVSPAIDAQDVPPSATNYFIVNPSNALAPARNTSQVLGVVYGASTPATTAPPTGITVGGFFRTESTATSTRPKYFKESQLSLAVTFTLYLRQEAIYATGTHVTGNHARRSLEFSCQHQKCRSQSARAALFGAAEASQLRHRTCGCGCSSGGGCTHRMQ